MGIPMGSGNKETRSSHRLDYNLQTTRTTSQPEDTKLPAAFRPPVWCLGHAILHTAVCGSRRGIGSMLPPNLGMGSLHQVDEDRPREVMQWSHKYPSILAQLSRPGLYIFTVWVFFIQKHTTLTTASQKVNSRCMVPTTSGLIIPTGIPCAAFNCT